MLQTHSDHNKASTQYCLIIDLTKFVTQAWSKTVELRNRFQWRFKKEMLTVLNVINQGPCLFLWKLVNFAFHKGWDMSWIGQQLSASQELYSMELVQNIWASDGSSLNSKNRVRQGHTVGLSFAVGVPITPNNTLYRRDDTAVNWVTPFDGGVFVVKQSFATDVCRNISNYFLRNHTKDSLCANLFSLCAYVVQWRNKQWRRHVTLLCSYPSFQSWDSHDR